MSLKLVHRLDSSCTFNFQHLFYEHDLVWALNRGVHARIDEICIWSCPINILLNFSRIKEKKYCIHINSKFCSMELNPSLRLNPNCFHPYLEFVLNALRSAARAWKIWTICHREPSHNTKMRLRHQWTMFGRSGFLKIEPFDIESRVIIQSCKLHLSNQKVTKETNR